MVDYAKKTVAELQEILKSRSLPHSGKKAELIARLNAADKAAEESAKPPPEEPVSAPPAQAPEPTPTPVAEAPEVPESASAPTEVDATDSPSANTDSALANSASYALNLPSSDVDSEMAKRKARAERFGTGVVAANGNSGDASATTTDADALKALERAKRFGIGQTAMGKLDEALPAENERGARNRGRTDESSAMDDPGLRRGFGGRGRGRFRGGGGRDNSRRRVGEKPSGIIKSGSAFSTEADRLAAEARRKKFASAS
ncbi:uncharacterized protein Z518_04023 [Rhinocladiella mackenziei CBS 650.93]|uniref:SAP domain-containing protein n=1 Tax=Rhinocladiella mackenziei CBS 650.93 TaxID=1442369 RepID=A0A0D2IK46_9EURO|nr:uncharacterized protein Z518_04023 [Rhinocladiella mackenziei CBS 650.93]KIX06049.1 hypothetical protein Z518_04023 [Rhinocladiella mackenziei CBS 650.93]